MSDIGIVGGGYLGLTLALRLSQAGHRVTVLEAAPDPGGLAAANPIGSYTWDRFYHVILRSDLQLRKLLNEVGVGHLLRWQRTHTGFLVAGRLHSLSSTLDFLRFPPLSLWAKARLALTILRAAYLKDSSSLEPVNAVAWLTRWSGRKTVDRLWIPLLKSKLGSNYDRVSAAFIWAIIARMYAARRSGLKHEMFGYVEGGYARVLPALLARLEALGVTVRTGCAVSRVEDLGAGVRCHLQGGELVDLDHMVLTVPCGRIAAICPELTDGERTRLDQVVYQGVTCASVLLRKPLARYYVTNITDSWVPFTAVIEMTALVDPAQFGGNALVYLPRYATRDDPVWTRSDDELREEFLSALERIYPAFRRADVLTFQVARAREVQALATLEYSRLLLPPLRTSLPNVSIVNSAQIRNGTLNLNETVGLAERQARRLLKALGAGRLDLEVLAA